MGIRFLCPNGHKLNVKAYLAGERGICPQCDAKFLVPSESGGQVAAIVENANGAAEVPEAVSQTVAEATSPAAAVAPPPPPAPSQPSAPAPPETPAPTEVWYVRAANGEQYGPASKDVMHSWVAEGRVTVDCWVWKSGWPDWKSGGQAITLLNVVAPSGSPSSEPTTPVVNKEEVADEGATQPAPETLPEPTNPTALYQTNKRRRQERARKITLLLGVVVVVLFAVLIAVLMNNQ